jgi:hypothetical protein
MSETIGSDELPTRRKDYGAMQLRLLGISSDRGGCPSVFETDQGTLVVQGWKIPDAETLAQLDLPDHESAVEIPRDLLQFFPAAP